MLIRIFDLTKTILDFQQILSGSTRNNSIAVRDSLLFEQLFCANMASMKILSAEMSRLNPTSDSPPKIGRKRGRPRKAPLTEVDDTCCLMDLVEVCIQSLDEESFSSSTCRKMDIEEIGENEATIEDYLDFMKSLKQNDGSSSQCRHLQLNRTYQRRKSIQSRDHANLVLLHQHWCSGIIVHPLSSSRHKTETLLQYFVSIAENVYSEQMLLGLSAEDDAIVQDEEQLIAKFHSISNKKYGLQLLYHTLISLYCLNGEAFMNYRDRIIQKIDNSVRQGSLYIHTESLKKDFDFCTSLLFGIYSYHFPFLQDFGKIDAVGKSNDLIISQEAVEDMDFKTVLQDHQNVLDSIVRFPIISGSNHMMVEPLNIEELDYIISSSHNGRTTSSEEIYSYIAVLPEVGSDRHWWSEEFANYQTNYAAFCYSTSSKKYSTCHEEKDLPDLFGVNYSPSTPPPVNINSNSIYVYCVP